MRRFVLKDGEKTTKEKLINFMEQSAALEAHGCSPTKICVAVCGI
jgi:hypothetical protein